MKRRLAAILAADAVAFSAFAARDESAAIRALKGHVGAMEPMIGINSGRIVKNTGDGFLAEFGSVVDAVACADAAQKMMAERNAGQPDGARLDFRMGVHVGDIVIDGDDILGDGVNIAARLEGIAPPGGVAVSSRVHEDVAGKLDLAFDDLGPRELKNIARPIHVFALGAAGAKPAAAPVALPDKPSVAVLPFANMSRAEEDDYFADGVTEDIITALSYVPWIFVIARNSSFTYKGLNVDIRKVGEELGVRYVLEGSVRRSGRRLRVTGQLIDAETGAHIWAEKYDGEVEDVFDLQDRISESVVSAIAPEIRASEIEKCRRRRPDSFGAYDYYLSAQDALNHNRVDDARDWLDKAIAAAPDYAKAIAQRGWIETVSHMFGVAAAPKILEHAAALARRSLEIDGADPEVRAYAGYTISFTMGDHQEGLRSLRQAVDRCPSFAWGWASLGLVSVYAGQPEQALDHARTALRLSPRDPQAFRAYIVLCLANVCLGDYPALLEYASAGLNLNPAATVFLRYRILANNALGNAHEAAADKARHDQLLPGFRVGPYIELVGDRLNSDQRLWRAMQTALLTAGFPP